MSSIIVITAGSSCGQVIFIAIVVFVMMMMIMMMMMMMEHFFPMCRVEIMDECIFQQLFAKKVKLQRPASVLHSYQTNENPSRPFTVMGKFDAVLESNT